MEITPINQETSKDTSSEIGKDFVTVEVTNENNKCCGGCCNNCEDSSDPFDTPTRWVDPNNYTFEFGVYAEKTTQTAIYPTLSAKNYIKMGFIGEFGEIFNKLKKVIRDGDKIMTPEWRVDFGKEIGDVLWYMGRQFAENSGDRMGFYDYYDLSKKATMSAGFVVDNLLSELLYHIQNFDSNNFNPLLISLNNLALIYAGKNLQEIADENMEKLLSRKARNVIAGNGDNR